MRLSTTAVLCCWLALASGANADQTDPRLDDLFSALGEAADSAQSVPIERQIWTIWLETSDETADTLMRSGITAMQLGNNRAALTFFDRIVDVAPEFAEGWNKRATVHYVLGNLQESLRDIERTLDLEPRHFGALAGRGLVHIALGDLESALGAFEEALAVAPQLSGTRQNIEAIRRALRQREI